MTDPSALEEELREWQAMTRTLRHHGLPTIEPSNQDTRHFTEECVVFDVDVSRRMRENLTALMNDVKRRQELVQELIQTNNQLREELSAQTNVSERYEARSRDLRTMLENSKSKVEALEQEMQNATFTKDSHEEASRNTMGEMRARVKHLQQKCAASDAEVERLQLKLRRINDEEEKRIQKQGQVIQQLRRRTGRSLDDKVLDVVENYERQIATLQQQLDVYLPDDKRHTNDSTAHLDNGSQGNQTTPQYKALIKASEKEIRDGKKKIKSLENDLNLLQLELQGRPDIKDLRDCQTKLKKLERIVKKHNLMDTEEKMKAVEKKKYSTQVDDIDFLPLPHCRSYLKIICNELGVFDLDHVTTKVKKTAKAVEAFPRLEQFAKQVLSMLETENISRPPGVPMSVSSSGGNHEVWCEKSWNHAIPTLQHWCRQLQSLQELEASIKKLNSTLLPWRNMETSEAPPTVHTLIEHVDAIIYETQDDGITNKKQSKYQEPTKDQASRAMLQGIIDHFMNLFDVSKVTGCYARMNDVYTKLGETHNVLKTLRDLLGLGRDSKSSAIIDAVSRLCQLQDKSAHVQLRELFPEEDHSSIVRKLKIHNEFFPVFHEIMTELMNVTDVNRIDQVVPAVKALKMLVDAR